MYPDFSQYNQLKSILYRAETLSQNSAGHTKLGLDANKKIVSEEEFEPEAESTFSSWSLGYFDYRSVKSFDDASQSLKDAMELCCVEARAFAGMSISVIVTPKMSSEVICEESKKLVKSDWGQFQELHQSVMSLLATLGRLTPTDDKDVHTEKTLSYFKNKMLLSFNEKLKHAKNPKLFRAKINELYRTLNHLGAEDPDASCVKLTLTNRLLNGLQDLAIEPALIPPIPQETAFAERMECALDIIRAACDSFDCGLRGQQIRAYGQEAATQLEKALKGCELDEREKLILTGALDNQLTELQRRNKHLSPDNQAMDPLIRTVNAATYLIKTERDKTDSQPTSLGHEVHQLIEKTTAVSSDDLNSHLLLSEVAEQSDLLLKDKLDSLTEDETTAALSELSVELLSSLPGQSTVTQLATRQILSTAATFSPKPAVVVKKPHQDFAEHLARNISFDCFNGKTGRRHQRQWFEQLTNYLKGYPDDEHQEVVRAVIPLVETTLRSEATEAKQAALINWTDIQLALELPPTRRPKKRAQEQPLHTTVPDELPRLEAAYLPLPEPEISPVKPVRNDEVVINKLWIQINHDISDDRSGHDEQKVWFDLLNDYLQPFSQTEKDEIRMLALAQVQAQINELAEKFPAFANHQNVVDSFLLMLLTGRFQAVEATQPLSQSHLHGPQPLDFRPITQLPTPFNSSEHGELIKQLSAQIKGDLLTKGGKPQIQSVWHQALAGHLYDYPEQQHSAILSHVVESVLAQLTVKSQDHPEINASLQVVQQVLQQGLSLDFTPVEEIVLPAISPEVPVIPPHVDTTVPVSKPHRAKADPTLTVWPSFNGKQLGLQAGILFESPRHLLVGMDERGNLTFNADLTPEFELQVSRLQKSMEYFLVQQVFPAAGPSMSFDKKNRLHLPSQPGQCTVEKLQAVVAGIAGNPLAINLLAVEPPSEDVRKRFEQTEGKAMIIGCGAGYEEHQHLHPATTTFTADAYAGMLPDLHGDISTMIHTLPDKEQFSSIYFEHINGIVFSNPDQIKATLKKCHSLLKPGGILIIVSGSYHLTQTGENDIRHIMVECMSEAGFDDFKYSRHQDEVKQAFLTLDQSKDVLPQVSDAWDQVKGTDAIPVSEDAMHQMGILMVALKKKQ